MEALNISVVIPVYNEEENLPKLYRRLRCVFEQKLKVTYEIIFVDDGSKDTSWSIIEGLHNRNKAIKGIRFSRNFGQHTAITAGFKHARGEAVIILDADLQNPPEEIPKLLKEYDKGYDIVYGVRQRRKDNLFRRMASKIVNRLFSLFLEGESFHDLSAFRAMRRETYEEILQGGFDFGYLDYYSNWINANSGKVYVSHAPRVSGKSHYNFFKLLFLTFRMLVDYTILPLRLGIYVGILTSMGGFIYSIIIVAQKLIYKIDIPGYASIIIAIMFFCGIQLIILGILGEYLGRIFIRQQNKPLYRINKVLF